VQNIDGGKIVVAVLRVPVILRAACFHT
jgi:hypothetical protein